MRITELNLTSWTPARVEDPAAAARERRVADELAAQATAHLNVLDTDHDGWIDEDDLPYDQLRLLERARASEPVVEPPATPPRVASEAAPPAAVQSPAPVPQPARPFTAAAPPRIDLLA